MNKNNARVINSNQNYMTFKPLQKGQEGEKVEKLQTMLVTMAHIYPDLLIIAVDGKFGNNTEIAVKQFQNIIGHEPNGIVDIYMWNRLQNLYEQNKGIIMYDMSQDRNEENGSLDESNNVIHEGSKGEYVTTLQKYLNIISNQYPSIIKVKVDGIFGPETKSAVFEFQKIFGLAIDGIVGMETWEKLYDLYTKITGEM